MTPGLADTSWQRRRKAGYPPCHEITHQFRCSTLMNHPSISSRSSLGRQEVLAFDALSGIAFALESPARFVESSAVLSRLR